MPSAFPGGRTRVRCAHRSTPDQRARPRGSTAHDRRREVRRRPGPASTRRAVGGARRRRVSHLRVTSRCPHAVGRRVAARRRRAVRSRGQPLGHGVVATAERIECRSQPELATRRRVRSRTVCATRFRAERVSRHHWSSVRVPISNSCRPPTTNNGCTGMATAATLFTATRCGRTAAASHPTIGNGSASRCIRDATTSTAHSPHSPPGINRLLEGCLVGLDLTEAGKGKGVERHGAMLRVAQRPARAGRLPRPKGTRRCA